MTSPLITVAIPSYQQGKFLRQALDSVLEQDMPVEILLADGGSTDGTRAIIDEYRPHLAWWRSAPDDGQSAAINEAMARGSAPYVCWLNSDDMLLPGGLRRLLDVLEQHPEAPAAYGKSWEIDAGGQRIRPYWTAPFSAAHLANRCMISQPATLIRREAWEAVQGVDAALHMAMDYDLWWRLYRHGGALAYLPEFVACSRIHGDTKTSTRRREHYREAMATVKRHYGRIPAKWYLAWVYAVEWKALASRFRRAGY